MGNVAVAIVRRGADSPGMYDVIADLTFSSSYATGGDTIQDADIAKLMPEGFKLTDVVQFVMERPTSGHAASLDRTNKKLLAFNGTTQIANATDLSAVVMRSRLTYGGVVGAYT